MSHSPREIKAFKSNVAFNECTSQIYEMQGWKLKGSEVSTSLFATISLLEVGNDGYLHKTFYDVLGWASKSLGYGRGFLCIVKYSWVSEIFV